MFALILRSLPRLCRVGAITALRCNELGVFQSFPDNATKRLSESTSIIVFAFVKSKRLLIQIPEQMKRLNVHIRPMQRAFKQRPKVFQSVRMDVALRVANSMVNNSSVII